MNNQPIGLFDSGVGGTSIWKEIHKLLPSENTIYLADSINAPYGEKSKAEIIALSRKNTELLIQKNCKIIVVACNTATTNAIAELRASYEIPFIGIEPAIKPAAIHSKTHAIGILATKGTLSSTLFYEAVQLYKDVHVIEQIGHGLVNLIEDGKINSPEMFQLLKSYLDPMIDKNIDYLVLGCSHYPYLVPIIKQIIPEHVQIIDSGEAVAKQTKKVLELQELLSLQKSAEHLFYTNTNPMILRQIVGVHNVVNQIDF